MNCIKSSHHPAEMRQTNITINDIAIYDKVAVADVNARRHKTTYKAVLNFEDNKEELIPKLCESLKSGTFRTSPYVRMEINDAGKQRIIHKLPYYPDRLVHWMIMRVLEPIFMEELTDRTHAALKGRGTHSALKQVREVLKNPEIKYCLKIDVRKYFPNISQELLKSKLYEYLQDYGFRTLVFENINSLEHGVPIGNYTSQFWANYYLSDFDKWLISLGFQMIRYMDDIVIFSTDIEKLRALERDIVYYLDINLGLEMKPNWQVFPIESRGIDFVGYRVFANRVMLRKSTWLKMQRRMKKIRRNAAVNGNITEREMSQLSSDMGRTAHCTPKVRIDIYKKLFEPIVSTANIKLTPKLRRIYHAY